MTKTTLKIWPAVLLLFLVGCASTPKPQPSSAQFYPPRPELPRIQYLTSFTGRKDVEEQSGFNKFVEGEKADIQLDKPYGVGTYDGKIYVCDTNRAVTVFDLKNKKYGYLQANEQGRLIEPLNISVFTDGTKYITDPIRGQVVAFDAQEQYVNAYGTPGKWKPVDAVRFENQLYVVDNEGAAVQVFDVTSGALVKTIGNTGDIDQRLQRPTNIAVDQQGYLYVTDVGRFQVIKYDRDGHYRSAFGKAGDNLGHFSRPKGIAIDRNGLIYVADAAFNNVQIFNKDGRLLLFFGGDRGNQPGGLILPAKVMIDYNNIEYFKKYIDPNFQVDYLILITSQFGDHLLNVFAYGKEKGKKYPTEEELVKRIEERREEERKRLEKTKQGGQEPQAQTQPQQP